MSFHAQDESDEASISGSAASRDEESDSSSSDDGGTQQLYALAVRHVAEREQRAIRARLARKFNATCNVFSTASLLSALEFCYDHLLLLARLLRFPLSILASLSFCMAVLLGFGWTSLHLASSTCSDPYVVYLSDWLRTFHLPNVCTTLSSLRQQERAHDQFFQATINSSVASLDSLANLSVAIEATTNFGPQLAQHLAKFSAFATIHDSSLVQGYGTALSDAAASLQHKARLATRLSRQFTLMDRFHQTQISTHTRLLSAQAQTIIARDQARSTISTTGKQLLYVVFPSLFASSPTGLFIQHYIDFLQDHIADTDAVLVATSTIIQALSEINSELADIKQTLASEQLEWKETCLPLKQQQRGLSSFWERLHLFSSNSKLIPDFCIVSPAEHSAMLNEAAGLIHYLFLATSQTHDDYITLHDDFAALSSLLAASRAKSLGRFFHPDTKGVEPSRVKPRRARSVNGYTMENLPHFDPSFAFNPSSARNALNQIVPMLESIRVFDVARQEALQKKLKRVKDASQREMERQELRTWMLGRSGTTWSKGNKAAKD